MKIDTELLYEFERGLDPQKLSGSHIPAVTLGYGEISTIFQIGDQTDVAYKRLPLFRNRAAATGYIQRYIEYSRLLIQAGLFLTDHQAVCIDVPQRPVTVYIAQKRLPSKRFGHHIVRTCGQEEHKRLVACIVTEIEKVWRFNSVHSGSLELALDGQISNWAIIRDESPAEVTYVDTSTPLFRKGGVEQLDPEPLLQGAPVFLRWILRLFFLDDVMNRYYDKRQVFIDLAANLYKEQRSDLIPPTIDVINEHLASSDKTLTLKEIEKYYREDKLIWTLFLAFRRIDRWLTMKILRRRYEFILPGKIKR
jgi:hypothetical protein